MDVKSILCVVEANGKGAIRGRTIQSTSATLFGEQSIRDCLLSVCGWVFLCPHVRSSQIKNLHFNFLVGHSSQFSLSRPIKFVLKLWIQIHTHLLTYPYLDVLTIWLCSVPITYTQMYASAIWLLSFAFIITITIITIIIIIFIIPYKYIFFSGSCCCCMLSVCIHHQYTRHYIQVNRHH